MNLVFREGPTVRPKEVASSPRGLRLVRVLSFRSGDPRSRVPGSGQCLEVFRFRGRPQSVSPFATEEPLRPPPDSGSVGVEVESRRRRFVLRDWEGTVCIYKQGRHSGLNRCLETAQVRERNHCHEMISRPINCISLHVFRIRYRTM